MFRIGVTIRAIRRARSALLLAACALFVVADASTALGGLIITTAENPHRCEWIPDTGGWSPRDDSAPASPRHPLWDQHGVIDFAGAATPGSMTAPSGGSVDSVRAALPALSVDLDAAIVLWRLREGPLAFSSPPPSELLHVPRTSAQRVL
jgi:hypothetical protein